MLKRALILLLLLLGASLGFYFFRSKATHVIIASDFSVIVRGIQSSEVEPALYEPETGCILGAFLDLDPMIKQTYRDMNGKVRKLPSSFEKTMGVRHGMYFFYLGYGQPLPKDWVAKLAESDKCVHIALEPNKGLDKIVADDYLMKLAADLRDSKAKVFIRFGSEINGSWTKYTGNPELFKEKFRLLTTTFREFAPNVAMMYCVYTTPKKPVLDYYPGDEYVDWIGINMYNVTFFDQNPKTPASQVHPRDMLQYVYKTFASKKPIMICEYATTNYSALEDKPVVDYAVSNVKELYRELPTLFPRVKAINYFNSNNLLVKHRKNNNYLLEEYQPIKDTYLALVSPSYYIKQASLLPHFARSDRNFHLEEISHVRSDVVLKVYSSKVKLEDTKISVTINGKAAGQYKDDENTTITVYSSEFSKGENVIKVTVTSGNSSVSQQHTVIRN